MYSGQIAVAVVIAVEEALRLMAVDGDVGGVQIEHDLFRRRGLRLQIDIHQQLIDLLGRVADLVIAGRAPGQLQPVQSALARQRLPQLPLAAEHPRSGSERNFS